MPQVIIEDWPEDEYRQRIKEGWRADQMPANERGSNEGDLPAGLVPEDLARFIFTLIEGMAAQVRDDASAEELRRMVALALRVWPE